MTGHSKMSYMRFFFLAQLLAQQLMDCVSRDRALEGVLYEVCSESKHTQELGPFYFVCVSHDRTLEDVLYEVCSESKVTCVRCVV
jgi:hypothetical protein